MHSDNLTISNPHTRGPVAPARLPHRNHSPSPLPNPMEIPNSIYHLPCSPRPKSPSMNPSPCLHTSARPTHVPPFLPPPRAHHSHVPLYARPTHAPRLTLPSTFHAPRLHPFLTRRPPHPYAPSLIPGHLRRSSDLVRGSLLFAALCMRRDSGA